MVLMEKNKKFDLCVVGGGPGGYVAAIRGAQLGLKTVLIEKKDLGGVCLNWGCIPSKSLLKNAEIYSLIKNAAKYGISVSNIKHDWSKVIKRSREVSKRLNKGVAYLMKKNNIKVIYGDASICKDNIVKIDKIKTPFNVENIVIATGCIPKTILNKEFSSRIISYKQALVLKKQPQSIVIIGAGAIGIEFTYFFNSFGTKVTLLE